MSVKVHLTNGNYSVIGDGLGGMGGVKDLYAYNMESFFEGEPSLTLFSASMSYTNPESQTKLSPLSINKIFKDCNSLTYVITDIQNTQTAQYAFENCSELILFQPITMLSSLKDATGMFKNCKVFPKWIDVPLPALEIADYMFEGCERFNDFWYEADHTGIKVEFATFNRDGLCTHALTSAKGMFKNTHGMLKFNARVGGVCEMTDDQQLPFLGPSDITEMFYGSGVHHFDTSLHSVMVADKAFMDCTHLKSFNSSVSMSGISLYGLPLCTSAVSCFENCTELEELILPEFTGIGESGLPWASLVNGNRMFANSGLKRLVNDTVTSVEFLALRKGVDMFLGCALDKASVLALSAGLPDIQGQTSDGTAGFGVITIEFDTALNEDTDVQSAIGSIQQKGWSVKCPQLSLN